jgi:carboxyl-terminal processing protease
MKRMTRPGFTHIAAAVAATLAVACAPAARAQDAPADRPAQAGIALPEEQVQKLLATYALIKQNYVGEADDKKLFDAALSGMLSSLDAHSQYLGEEDMRELGRSESGDYVGIGIEVEFDRDRTQVISVTPDSPAERAGIAPGDVIVAVDGMPLAGLPDSDAARRMAGAPGTVATIDVERRGQSRTLRVAREALHDATVRTRMASRGVAWIRVSEFGGATGADLAAALKQLDGKAPPLGVVLDLRNDPGGLVAAGVAVAGAFLPQGAVVFSARGREADAQATVTVDERYYRLPGEADVLAGLPAWTRTVPLVVLVNGASASAAELVAGALQDHHRATIVGTRTFGKGSIQSVIPLTEDTGIKLTVARYFTPNGREIQAHGVTPDIVAAPVGGADGAWLLREADLANHLPPAWQDTVESARTPAEPTRRFGTRSDKALRTAVALLEPKDRRGAPWLALLHRLRAGLTHRSPGPDVASAATAAADAP